MSHEYLVGSHSVSSLRELDVLASMFAGALQSGDIVCLQGDLGAGKTTFVQHVGKALGVHEEITSPTYTMVAEYEIHNNSRGSTKLVHVDAYRESLDTNYVHEIFGAAKKEQTIIMVEWPEKLGAQISGQSWTVSFNTGAGNNERIIAIGRVE